MPMPYIYLIIFELTENTKTLETIVIYIGIMYVLCR